MNNLSKQEILDALRKLTPKLLAAEILTVQPMDEAAKAYAELYELLKSHPDFSLTFVEKKPDVS